MSIGDPRRAILLDLAEDPRIAWGATADHHGIAAGLADHGACIFGAADVPIADYRNFDRVFNGSDPLPAGVSAIAHLPRAGVQRDSGQAAAFGHAGQFHADDFLVVPSGAKFYGEGNLHRDADRFENPADGG